MRLTQAGVQVPQAVGHHLVGHVALEVDDEAVLAQLLLGRPGLQLHQVEVPGRELAQDPVQAPRVVGRLEAHHARLVVPRRRRDARLVAGRRARSGWRCRRGPRSGGRAPPARTARRPGRCRWRRCPAAPPSADQADRLGGRVAATSSTSGRLAVEPGPALAGGVGERHHPLDVGHTGRPGGASRFWVTGRTTSPTIIRSRSNTSWSRAIDTVPSMEFSMATKP